MLAVFLFSERREWAPVTWIQIGPPLPLSNWAASGLAPGQLSPAHFVKGELPVHVNPPVQCGSVLFDINPWRRSAGSPNQSARCTSSGYDIGADGQTQSRKPASIHGSRSAIGLYKDERENSGFVTARRQVRCVRIHPSATLHPLFFCRLFPPPALLPVPGGCEVCFG
jgi:hypothetical protein